MLLVASHPVSLQAQETKIGGFADAYVRGMTGRTSGVGGFGLGQFDLYITSKLADKVFFLGETVFEYDKGWRVDVERVVLTVAPRPYFQLSLGKHHTPIGYWNNAFHHGALLQPTAERPELVRFEDEGGVLPIHTTGLLVSGRDISQWHLGYDVLLGNGIGATPTEDNNPSKSVTLAVHSQLTPTLRVGTSMYFDRISAGTPNLSGDTLASAVSQQMIGGFVAWMTTTAELVAEYHHVANRAEGAASRATDGSYVYLGRPMGEFVPYVRYDRIGYSAGDPYFTGDNVEMGTVGIRYDFAPTAGVKMEFRSRNSDRAGRVTQFELQFAIGF